MTETLGLNNLKKQEEMKKSTKAFKKVKDRKAEQFLDGIFAPPRGSINIYNFLKNGGGNTGCGAALLWIGGVKAGRLRGKGSQVEKTRDGENRGGEATPPTLKPRSHPAVLHPQLHSTEPRVWGTLKALTPAQRGPFAQAVAKPI